LNKELKGYKARAAHLLKDFGDFIALKLEEIALFNSNQAEAMGAAVAAQIGVKWGGMQFYFPATYIRAQVVNGRESSAERDRIELLNDFETLIASQLEEAASVRAREALDIARQIAEMLPDEWRNEVFYIPKSAHKLASRDDEICRRMRMGNANELAREYGLSRVRIYQIARARAAQRREQSKDQGSSHNSESAANSHRWLAAATN
jgi:Mor family transcriptional regulator